MIQHVSISNTTRCPGFRYYCASEHQPHHCAAPPLGGRADSAAESRLLAGAAPCLLRCSGHLHDLLHLKLIWGGPQPALAMLRPLLFAALLGLAAGKPQAGASLNGLLAGSGSVAAVWPIAASSPSAEAAASRLCRRSGGPPGPCKVSDRPWTRVPRCWDATAAAAATAVRWPPLPCVYVARAARSPPCSAAVAPRRQPISSASSATAQALGAQSEPAGVHASVAVGTAAVERASQGRPHLMEGRGAEPGAKPPATGHITHHPSFPQVQLCKLLS